MKKRILIVLQDFRGGGAERVAVLLANGLYEIGFELKVLALDISGPMREGLNESISVERIPAKRILRSPLALSKKISNFRPEWVISHMTHVNVAVLIAKFLTRWRCKYIVIEHNHIQKNIVYKRRLVRLSYHTTKLLYRFANGLVCVSDGVAKSLSGFTGIDQNRMQVIHNPVINQRLISLSNKQTKQPDHHKFFDNNKKVILAVGSLTAQKGYMGLLSVFKEVQKSCRCLLIILGEGDQRHALEEKIIELGLQDIVDMPGYCNKPYEMMQHADLYVLPSLWEGLPTVLIEALLFSKKIIAADCISGPREILKGGLYGRLIEPNNHEIWVETIVQELSVGGVREGMKKRALDFSVAAACKKYETLMVAL